MASAYNLAFFRIRVADNGMLLSRACCTKNAIILSCYGCLQLRIFLLLSVVGFSLPCGFNESRFLKRVDNVLCFTPKSFTTSFIFFSFSISFVNCNFSIIFLLIYVLFFVIHLVFISHTKKNELKNNNT
jgi:hypothetical protein